jgi:hypothetical protein
MIISHFIFRLYPADLVIFAGVLNNTQKSSEDTKVVRQVTEVFLHEGFDYDTLINDIAILKVRNVNILLSFGHICGKVQSE